VQAQYLSFDAVGVAVPMLVTPAQCAMLLKSQLANGRGSRLFVALVVLGGFGIIRMHPPETAGIPAAAW
jgi:hypothetical protein